MVDDFVKGFAKVVDELEKAVTRNPIWEARTRDIGYLSLDDAMDWGVTGANLRACGLEWDLRKKFPYSAYEAFDFEIPTAAGRRLLRPLPGAGGGDAPEPQDYPAGGRVRCPPGAISPMTTATPSPGKRTP